MGTHALGGLFQIKMSNRAGMMCLAAVSPAVVVVENKEDETNPKEAWNISQRELTKASSLTLLSMIGKVLTHKIHNL